MTALYGLKPDYYNQILLLAEMKADDWGSFHHQPPLPPQPPLLQSYKNRYLSIKSAWLLPAALAVQPGAALDHRGRDKWPLRYKCGQANKLLEHDWASPWAVIKPFFKFPAKRCT